MKYRVHMHSVPGMYEVYDGHVDVEASSVEQAEDRALDKLKRGAFPDRSRFDWRITKIETMP